MKEQRLKIGLLPKQLTFLRSQKKEKLLSGAFGAGKSRVLAYDAVQHARFKGNLVGLCRKTFTSLRETTLRVLLKPDGHLPPVLPEGTYEHNKSEHLIKLHDGGEIFYFGFDDELRVASLNLGAVFVDEGIELDEDEYVMLLGRLRNTADPCRQIGTATNPGTPSHFLYKRFFKDKDSSRLAIHTASTENYLLPQDYLQSLQMFEGQYKDRFVLGKWIAFEGMIYDNWNRDIHLVHNLGPFKWLLITVDEGYENPCSAGLHGVDSDNNLHRIKTFYKRHVLQDDLVKILKSLGTDILDNHNNPLERRFVVDPAAAGLIAAIEAAGLYVEPADNSVFDGIQETRGRLAVNGNDKPRYTVEKNGEGNEHFVEEIESYHYDKNEKPAKSFDHSMDEMRYGCMYMREYQTPQLFSLSFHETKNTNTDSAQRKSEFDIATEQKRDSAREIAIKVGYVPKYCKLDGLKILELVRDSKDPCIDCEFFDECLELKRKKRVHRDEILSRQSAWG